MDKAGGRGKQDSIVSLQSHVTPKIADTFGVTVLTSADPQEVNRFCPLLPNIAMALLLALVLLCSVAEGEEIKLGFLHIQSSSSWVVESYQQFKLGLQHINADSTLLPNDILKAVPYNGEGQSLVSMKGALHLIEQDQVVGPVRATAPRTLRLQ